MKEAKLLEEMVFSWKPSGLRITIQKYKSFHGTVILEELSLKGDKDKTYVEHCGKCNPIKLYELLKTHYTHGKMYECKKDV